MENQTQKRKNDVVLEMNKLLYSADSIKKALDHYKDVCKGQFTDGEKYVITLSPVEDVDNNILRWEFSNYVLYLMKSDGVV